jgi:hypothetical protein
MAKIYPTFTDDFHSSLGEYKIFNALKKLPDDWYVLYSLNWNNKLQSGKVQWGEADFVILNRIYGLLVIEVKSGGIEYKEGNWIQTRLDNFEKNPMKNPFKQADKSKYKFISLLDNVLYGNKKCYIDKAVWFPSIKNIDSDSLPPEYDDKIVLTEEALDNPLQYIIRAFDFYNSKHYTYMEKDDFDKVLSALMPEFNLIPSASNIIEENDYSFLQLTQEQKKVLDFISDQGNASIQGGAGTGKTFIAVEQAKRFSDYGEVLFLCFNRYLYKHLENNCFHKNVEYLNIHTFINRYSSDNILSNEELLKVLKTIDFSELNYKFIIIDEAQDFDNKILSLIVEKATESNIRCFVFYDKNQLLYSDKMPAILNDFECKLTLNKNCRNTFKILSTTNSPMNLPIRTDEYCIEGIMPRLYISTDKDKIVNKIGESINNYLSNGYKLDDIVILTLNTEDSSILSGVSKINNYDISHEKIEGKLLFTTAKKFKGLESNIVILVDFNSDVIATDELTRLFYVSTSRARQLLDIFYYNINDDIKLLSDKIDGDQNSFVKISKMFKVRINEID